MGTSGDKIPPLSPFVPTQKGRGDKWGQGGDKVGICPPSVVGTRWGQNFIYIPPSKEGGYKMYCPPCPPFFVPFGGDKQPFCPHL